LPGKQPIICGFGFSLAHCDTKLTMRYAHLAPGHLHDSVNALNDLGGRKQGEGKLLEFDRRIKS